MPKLMLDRQTLARLLQNDHQAIVAFEKVLGDVGGTIPSTLEEVAALASMASSMANLALELLAKNSEQLDLVSFQPVAVAPPHEEDYRPATAFGTIGQQNADSVEITGGSIDGTTIGATSASTGAFTTLTASAAVTLSPANANVVMAPTGTGVVTINPATLGSMDRVAIGATTPAAAAVTTLTASAAVTLSPANAAVNFSPTGTGTVTISPATASTMNNVAIGGTTPLAGAFTTLSATGAATVAALTASSSVIGTRTYSVAPAVLATSTGAGLGATFAAANSTQSQFLVGYSSSSTDTDAAIWWTAGTALRFATATDIVAGGFTLRATIDASGFKAVAGFGCNGAAPQTAYALGADSTDLASVIVLANNIRAALIANGIGS